jgi:hypothetical protein
MIDGEAMTDIDIDVRELAGRYVAVWNEPDAGLRRAAIRELWAEDGAHILQPPQQIRQAAAGLGFNSTTLQARGHDAAGAGLEILMLDEDGRIKTDYQFIEG